MSKTSLEIKYRPEIVIPGPLKPDLLTKSLRSMFRAYFHAGNKDEAPASPFRSRRNRIIGQYTKNKVELIVQHMIDGEAAKVSFDTLNVVIESSMASDDSRRLAFIDSDETHEDLSVLAVKHLNGIRLIKQIFIRSRCGKERVQQYADKMRSVGNLVYEPGVHNINKIFGRHIMFEWEVRSHIAPQRADADHEAFTKITPVPEAGTEDHRRLPHYARVIQSLIEAELGAS